MADADFPSTLLRKLTEAPHTTETVEALDAYVKADQACDKARTAYEVARQRREQRVEALEAALDASLAAKAALAAGEEGK